MRVLIALAFIVALIPLFSVLLTTIVNGVKRLNLNFLSYNMTGVVGGNPTPSGGYGGIQHAIIGTLEITFGAMVISIPIGLMCAVYLIEYSNRGKLARVITLLVDVMSGIPSIVAGLFAFSMFVILIGYGTINGFEGSVALSLLMLPTVVKSSEEMLKIVPHDLREASYALGVTKQRTITKIVLRTALPGIVSGAILAVARVIGETAPLLMTAGYIASTNVNLFSGQMTTLPVYVWGVLQAQRELPGFGRRFLRDHHPDGTRMGCGSRADPHRAYPQPYRSTRGEDLRSQVGTMSGSLTYRNNI